MLSTLPGKLARCLAAALPLTLLLAPLPAGAQATKLRFAVFIPESPVVTDVFKGFADAVNKDARGVVEVEVFANGALGRNPLQQAQMVLDGVADIAWVILPQSRGKFRETEVLELPGLFLDVTEASTVSARMVTKGHLKGFEEYFPIGVVGTGPMSIHSRGQVQSLADLKGKKIRAAGPMESTTIKALGAVPVGLTVNEVIEAIGRGNVDGITSLPSVLFDFGIAQVTTTHYFNRLGNLPMAILMNRRKFDSLPAAGQDAVRKYSGEWIAARFNESQGPYYASLTKQMQADPKRKVIFPSEAEFAATRELFRPVFQEWASQGPRNAELLKAIEGEIALVRGARR
jgi:TRAP-type C4-dicarboxylate transport system substrate-binding protein